MSGFRRLSRAELMELTGARSRRLVERWLVQHAWIFELDVNRWPIVSAAYAENKLSGISGESRKTTPNFAALKSAA